jgi:branched-chain amino acid transport system permease protein
MSEALPAPPVLARRTPRARSLPAQTPALRVAGAAAVAAAGAVLTVLVGFFGAFSARWLVAGWLDIGHATLGATALAVGVHAARVVAGPAARSHAPDGGLPRAPLAAAGVCGGLAGAALGLFAVLWPAADLRWMFVAVGNPVLRALAFGQSGGAAIALLAAAGAAFGATGGVLALAPGALRRIALGALGAVLVAGLLQEFVQSLVGGEGPLEAVIVLLYSYEGLLPLGAVAAAALGAGAAALAGPARAAAERRPTLRHGTTIAALAAILALPLVTNDFVAQVMLLIALYTLMSMGLNIELGLAGLLDLGFVAFFAVGAYTVALLTADSPLVIARLDFFAALPIAVVLAAVAGFVFGLPVLRVRGDYLAIATLGLGEIIRVLVISDMLKPTLGGAQGVVNIPKPAILGFVFGTPTRLFYLAAALAAFAGYCAWRLNYSRFGRQWQAVREDEDVAQALGINLVRVKLLAYTIGAAFAGLAGGLFATMLGAIFPQSFQLVVSMNVLAILVVGGVGSLPGVLVGAAALIGIPEVLREFGEFRYLIYGVAIIAVMRLKPEGLLPARSSRLEKA